MLTLLLPCANELCSSSLTPQANVVHLLHLPDYYAARSMYVGHRLVINCKQFPSSHCGSQWAYTPGTHGSRTPWFHKCTWGPDTGNGQWGIPRCMSCNFLIMLWSRSETHDQIIIPAGRLCNGEGKKHTQF